ncbi:hypothetical protein F6A46_12205 [Tenacibaculum finnmarkense genomovar ulcerans]|uniref:hypothetical protein n=1 Tax=Tenacibaculum finnmarkense TaxID=2781243 RepID=UPI00187BBECC|nr:hypothetical protein [Tenacibaculum finnmarkense]MBE7688982.1 hypothetical protein [Tenacibaculum finnmarkense genomovar ulcerans]
MNNKSADMKKSNIQTGKTYSLCLLVIYIINSMLEYFEYEKSWFYSFLITVTIIITYRVLLSIKTFLNENLNLKSANKFINILIFTNIVGGIASKLIIKYEDKLETIDISNNYLIIGILGILSLIVIEFIYYYKLGSILSKTKNKTALSFSTFAFTTIILNIFFIIFSIFDFNMSVTGLITNTIPLLFIINGFRIAGKKTNNISSELEQTKIPKSYNKVLVPLTAGISIFLVIYTNNIVNDNYSQSKISDLEENYNRQKNINNRANQLNSTNSYYQSRDYDSKAEYDNQTKASSDNRANQLNSNNNSYYQSRGYNSKAEYDNQTKASLDNRANQLNPNSSSYSGSSSSSSNAASNNRSNQMNPNNSAYKGGKK